MRYAIATTLPSLLLPGVLSSPVCSSPKVHEIVEIPDVWIENTAIRSNGNLLLNTIGDGKLYSLNVSQSPPKPQVIARFENVNALFGIAEVGNDVFAITGGDYGAKFQNDTMSLSLVQFVGNKTSVRTVFEKSKYGPVNGVTALPDHKHIILGADSVRGEILRIDTTTGHIDVAIKHDQLGPIPNGPFGLGVNGIKILGDYLYFTNSARQSFGRIKIDKLGNPIGKIKVISQEQSEKGPAYAPDDFVLDKYGNAYVAFWDGSLVKITTSGQRTVLVDDGLLAGATSVALSKDQKSLYVCTAGQGIDKVSGGQVVEVKL
ncbi:uncharacterized protein FIESC28_10925 [Fusarium coffeatum]|uniref:SMP-30/Gluconolactonase/LRE-like region domain-containing protein n=1 Tax=Fusarium coffeatum TaxID=231269 RepID=A0A366QPF8_9HYPO|nr:uncharacterized protein FIESC28_10925 [Fusarium coffeatum]RBR06809.1 hypothetical protein FIESC28_10925 [Fusarium coffeatum]